MMKKPLNIDAVAKRLGLSTWTVSSVLNGKAVQRRISPDTAKRVLEVVKELNYVPNTMARGLRSRRSDLIGVEVPDLQWNWAHRVQVGLKRALRETPYTALFAVRGWEFTTERQEIECLVERRVDGIVVCNPIAANEEFYRQALDNGIPLVFLGDTLEEMNWASAVVWASDQAAAKAVEYLIALGRQRIGFVGADHNTQMTAARFAAYRETVLAAGLPWREEWTHRTSVPASLEAQQKLDQWIERLYANLAQAPDAFFCLFDGDAVCVLHSLCKIGVRVPAQCAVVGMSNFPLLGPRQMAITSMDEPTEALGEAAGRLLLRLIENPNMPPVHEKIEFNMLLIRQSSDDTKS